MKRFLTAALCICFVLTCMSFAQADTLFPEKVTFSFLTKTNANYDMEQMDLYNYIEELTNVHIDLSYSSSMAETLTTMLATDDLPDIFHVSGLSQFQLVNEGAIVNLNDYLDKIPNYTRWLEDSEIASGKNIEDGGLYGINFLTIYPPTFCLNEREDWLKNLGLEQPTTLDEWLTVWRAIRDNDANGNGDPTDEIPYCDAADVWAGNGSHAMDGLLSVYGIKSNGTFYADEEGTYQLVYNHPRYREYLELCRLLYAEGLIDKEVFTHDYRAVEQLYYSNTVFSCTGWISYPPTAYNTLKETIPDVSPICVEPIIGPYGDQLISARPKKGNLYAINVNTIENGKLDQILEFINWIYSDEGIQATNYGRENIHCTTDETGYKKYVSDILTGDSNTLRKLGLINQTFLGLWTEDSYNQITTRNVPAEELDPATSLKMAGTKIYADYYYVVPPTIETRAWSEYSTDLMPVVEQLCASCITGEITVDEFFAKYQELASYGIDAINTEAQEAWNALN